jgi:cytochrome c553
MRIVILVAVTAVLAACGQSKQAPDQPELAATPAALNYDGADGDARASVEHGKRLTLVLGCTSCHGKDLRGDLFREEANFGRLHAPNLPLRIARYSNAQLEATLRGGRRPDGSELWMMPAEMYTHLGKRDMAALIAYLRSVPPGGEDKPPLVMKAGWRAATASGKFLAAPAYVADNLKKPPFDAGPAHARGRMITMTACSECHGPNLEGFEGDTAPNLDIAGAYSPEQFTTLMRTGKPASGKELKMMGGVARVRFSKLTDQEVAELYAYLKARAERPQ